jgi:hypothetical protein
MEEGRNKAVILLLIADETLQKEEAVHVSHRSSLTTFFRLLHSSFF